ncbi:MAG: cytochrome C oxidase subunit IV family protein [Methyloversatilis sp.]|uniref:cytochrome C oxidase subunit IV family protein n=1 Tax=Methyloversatilis sp. TaxID=2569862 RepID=UPI002735197F|nr:cytochrome C oxidase subunit IV family protein [Methyloversatilis sp.]MDP3871027.1 cytochrome C oxidase subunit IV family protein [Methyloversatilis sp.]
MNSRAQTLAWLALSALTLAGWWLGPYASGRWANWGLLSLTAFNLLIRHFMELGNAPAWLRLPVLGWLFGMLAFIAIMLS